MAEIGPCKRPGSTGEATETLAYKKAAQPSETRPVLAFQAPGLSAADIVPFDRSACEDRAVRGRCDDQYRPGPQPKYDEEPSAVRGRGSRWKRRPQTGTLARSSVGRA